MLGYRPFKASTRGIARLVNSRRSVSGLIMPALLIIIIAVMSASFAWTISTRYSKAREDLNLHARLITSQFVAIRSFMATEEEHETAIDYKHLDPAAVERGLNELFGEGQEYKVKEVWITGTLPCNAPDEWEESMIEVLRSDPSLSEYSAFDWSGGRRVFRYAVPLKMEEGCLKCHNPAQEPEITSSFKFGDLAGAISLQIPMDSFDRELRTEIFTQLAVTVTLIILIASSTYLILNYYVTAPLARLNRITAEIGRGNLDAAQEDINVLAELSVLLEGIRDMSRQLKEFYRGLEEQVAERTRELTEQKEELARAYDALAESSRLKSTFLASISHELKTPLTTIIAFAELLVDNVAGQLNQRQKEYVTAISENSQELLVMINDILDLAKIEARKMELKLRVFEVKDLVQTVMGSMEPLAMKKGIELSVDPGEGLPPVKADFHKVLQVVRNLVSNAIKFTPSGGRVTVRAELDRDGNSVLISVIDTGIGIRKEDEEIIFEAFRQLDDTTRREHRGTGLGLNLARSLAKLHGGSISVSSAIGKGSCFVFRLPLSPPQEIIDSEVVILDDQGPRG